MECDDEKVKKMKRDPETTSSTAYILFFENKGL
jgi:hypothetical protein